MEVVVEQATAGRAEPAAPGEHTIKEVSVICTAKNASATIERTIRSIRAQDFQNWEMIVIDDGSTDDTVDLINGFAQADARIRLVATGGIGRGRALNRAVAEAQADLVANIDADDESHPCRLRCQLKAMKQHPEFAVMASKSISIYRAATPAWPEIHAGAPFGSRGRDQAAGDQQPNLPLLSNDAQDGDHAAGRLR